MILHAQMMFAKLNRKGPQGSRILDPIVMSGTDINVDPNNKLSEMIMEVEAKLTELEIDLLLGLKAQFRNGKLEEETSIPPQDQSTVAAILKLYQNLTEGKFTFHSITRIVPEDGLEMMVIRYTPPE